jgi:hypothetical protein
MSDMRLQMNALPTAELENVAALIRQAKQDVTNITGFSAATMDPIKSDRYIKRFVK